MINRIQLSITVIKQTEASRLESQLKFGDPSPKVPATTNTLRHINKKVGTLFDLTRVEASNFGGQPENCSQFAMQHGNFIESRTKGQVNYILYLRHYCRGHSKKAIK